MIPSRSEGRTGIGAALTPPTPSFWHAECTLISRRLNVPPRRQEAVEPSELCRFRLPGFERQPMSNSRFKANVTVRLATGGPNMIAVGPTGVENRLWCEWEIEGRRYGGDFESRELVVVDYDIEQMTAPNPRVG
jgi:hypothetical protein